MAVANRLKLNPREAFILGGSVHRIGEGTSATLLSKPLNEKDVGSSPVYLSKAIHPNDVQDDMPFANLWLTLQKRIENRPVTSAAMVSEAVENAQKALTANPAICTAENIEIFDDIKRLLENQYVPPVLAFKLARDLTLNSGEIDEDYTFPNSFDNDSNALELTCKENDVIQIGDHTKITPMRMRGGELYVDIQSTELILRTDLYEKIMRLGVEDIEDVYRDKVRPNGKLGLDIRPLNGLEIIDRQGERLATFTFIELSNDGLEIDITGQDMNAVYLNNRYISPHDDETPSETPSGP